MRKYDTDTSMDLQINKNNFFSHELWVDISDINIGKVIELECIYHDYSKRTRLQIHHTAIAN